MASEKNRKAHNTFSVKSNPTSFPFLCIPFDSTPLRSTNNRNRSKLPTSCLLPNCNGLVMDDISKRDDLKLESRSEIKLSTSYPSDSSIIIQDTASAVNINCDDENNNKAFEYNANRQCNGYSDTITDYFIDTKTLQHQHYCSDDLIATENRTLSRELPNICHSFGYSSVSDQGSSLSHHLVHLNHPPSLSTNFETNSSIVSSRNQSSIGLSRIIDKLTRSKSRRSNVSESNVTINRINKDYNSDSEKECKNKGRAESNARTFPGERNYSLDILTNDKIARRYQKYPIKKSISFDHVKDKAKSGLSNLGSTPPRLKKYQLRDETDHLKNSSHKSESEGEIKSIRGSWSSNKKLSQINLKLRDAVCRSDYSIAKHILASSHYSKSIITDLLIDDLSLMDIALFTNHEALIALLARFNFKESLEFAREPELRINKLDNIVKDLQKQYSLLLERSANVNGCILKDDEKQLFIIEYKLQLYNFMLQSTQEFYPPDPPIEIQLTATSNSSLCVSWRAPRIRGGALVTRYLIQWGRKDFHTSVDRREDGEHLIATHTEVQDTMYYNIESLKSGIKYYVSVQAGNVTGWSQLGVPHPLALAPSSWNEWAGVIHTYDNYSCMELPRLYRQAKLVAEMCSSFCESLSQNGKEKNKMLTKIRNTGNMFGKMFGRDSVKFTKQVQASLYLCLLMYRYPEGDTKRDPQILLTQESAVPMINVEQGITLSELEKNNVQTFNWLSVVLYQWSSLKDILMSLCDLCESMSISLRRHLISRLSHLQESLSLRDLGLLHYTPIESPSGATIYCIVCQADDVRSQHNINGMKWSDLKSDITANSTTKVLSTQQQQQQQQQEQEQQQQNSSTILDTDYLMEDSVNTQFLLKHCPSLIDFHKNSITSPDPGLYLVLFHMQTCLHYFSIYVDINQPNMLPFVKIRNNSNVSKEEWIWLNTLAPLSLNNHTTKRRQVPDINGIGTTLQQHILQAWYQLKIHYKLNTQELTNYRLYTNEVIELSSEISLLIMLPQPCDVVTSLEISNSIFRNSSNVLTIQLTTFKLRQLACFQSNFLQNFALPTCLLEILGLIIGHKSREAISLDELSEIKNIIHQHSQCNDILKNISEKSNWISKLLITARNEEKVCGIPIKHLTLHSNKFIKPLDSSPQTEAITPNNHMTGILRIFPLYETGLARGTSVKISCTQSTTTKEIVYLVVQQLHSAVQKKNESISNSELTKQYLDSFILVSTYNNKNRILPDDCKPLLLPQPWSNGKLFVRPKLLDSISTTV